MSLHIIPPFLSPHPSPHFFKHTSSPPSLLNNRNTFLFLFFGSKNSFNKRCKLIRASLSGSENVNVLMDDQVLLSRVAGVKDANEALELIGEMSERSFGVVSNDDCCSIISAALDRNNVDLALSVFYAMRSSFDQGVGESSKLVDRWRWSRPNVSTFRLLVRGLSAALRVSDALKIISSVCRIGVSPSEEVPFGKIVKCPSCMIAAAVAQPQHGIQLVSCSKCRYQYELISGDIVSIESEEISMEVPAWERGLRLLKLKKQSIPAAVHSIVVETPSGLARTHRFATETVELPAQEGERVTVAVAAPSNVYRDVGPLRFRSKVPGFKPGEPICLTNHKTDRESTLLRAPPKDQSSPSLNPYILFPLFAALASGDAVSRIIDPSLPQLISVAVVASVAVGSTYTTLVLPQINRLPQRLVDVIAIRQQLLSQYYTLQSRIKDLREAAEKEVWMLARMCQLENKIIAVGEPSYNARKSKVKRVREGLENSLSGRIELIDSYARISSMIEIEIEMDSDVLAAEAASNVESVAEQIQQIMEIENLEERWRLQAEANDEVERLLSSQPIPMEPI